mgnify:FL=1
MEVVSVKTSIFRNDRIAVSGYCPQHTTKAVVTIKYWSVLRDSFANVMVVVHL